LRMNWGCNGWEWLGEDGGEEVFLRVNSSELWPPAWRVRFG
jgi:hypothetical protein